MPLRVWKKRPDSPTPGWVDVSVPLGGGMVTWPDNPAVKVERFLRMDKGDSANVARLQLGTHAGTHVDAPFHVLPDGATVESLPVEATVGPARVVDIDGGPSLGVDELEPHNPGPGERLLLRTDNSRRRLLSLPFTRDFAYLEPEGARWLVDRGVRTVGIDYLSIGGPYPEPNLLTHRILLEAGVCILEGLDLSHVGPGPCELLCLPLLIPGADGAPARAWIRRAPEEAPEAGSGWFPRPEGGAPPGGGTRR